MKKQMKTDLSLVKCSARCGILKRRPYALRVRGEKINDFFMTVTRCCDKIRTV